MTNLVTRKGGIDMGKMKNLAIDIMRMAEQIGDPWGFSDETADYIAMNLQISTAEVQAVLDMAVPKEYAEQSADLDADYYGRA